MSPVQAAAIIAVILAWFIGYAVGRAAEQRVQKDKRRGWK